MRCTVLIILLFLALSLAAHAEDEFMSGTHIGREGHKNLVIFDFDDRASLDADGSRSFHPGVAKEGVFSGSINLRRLAGRRGGRRRNRGRNGRDNWLGKVSRSEGFANIMKGNGFDGWD
ncbi:hypothetical protein BSKO_03165 [Bryopsis sp. KO-2023]|nr:hypothetical protein BSKO_03165 [Bryopsis sp. KO-2023]